MVTFDTEVQYRIDKTIVDVDVVDNKTLNKKRVKKFIMTAF